MPSHTTAECRVLRDPAAGPNRYQLVAPDGSTVLRSGLDATQVRNLGMRTPMPRLEGGGCSTHVNSPASLLVDREPRVTVENVDTHTVLSLLDEHGEVVGDVILDLWLQGYVTDDDIHKALAPLRRLLHPTLGGSHA